MRIELDYTSADSGRPEGTLRVCDDPDLAARPFSGTIELLRLLEDVAADGPSSDEGEQ